MRIKLVLLLIVFGASVANAQWSRKEFKEVKKGERMDLLQEGQTLSLEQEGTIQMSEPPTKLFATFLAGEFQPTSLAAASNGHTMNYSFDHYIPLVTAQFVHYPWIKNGKWGWSASIGYSYSQYSSNVQTALHFVPVELNAAYRIELKETQKIIPYVMAGPALWTYFQRGADNYNTSQSTMEGTATVGAAFNLNRFHLLSGQTETEVVLQYQRTIGASSGSMDFNGNTIQIGGTIAL